VKLSFSNINYACEVVKVTELIDLAGMDNCVGISVNGCMAIVSKGSVQVGDLGLLFPSECKLSKDFLAQNNLYRHEGLNSDTSKKGYFEDSGRVKALKVRGNVSTAFFCPTGHLSYLGIELGHLVPGDTFETINGIPVCEKFVRASDGSPGGRNQVKKESLSPVIKTQFQEHKDTIRFGKVYRPNIGQKKIVTQKLHGTSARFGNVQVLRKLTWIEKIARCFGVKVQEREYAGLIGTRRTVEIYDPNKKYDDVWAKHFMKVMDLIPKNWILYGEIVGFTGSGKSIQKNYTYDCEVGSSEFYVYRVAVVNESGFAFDLPWCSVAEWCERNGVKYVPHIGESTEDVEPLVLSLMNVKLHDKYSNCIKLSAKDKVDEGVVVRLEGLNPTFLKSRSPVFEAYESCMRDKGESDVEEDAVLTGREVSLA
jgi:RNA ligase